MKTYYTTTTNRTNVRHETFMKQISRHAIGFRVHKHPYIYIIIIIIIIIIIRNLYSAIIPLGGYRGAGGTGR